MTMSLLPCNILSAPVGKAAKWRCGVETFSKIVIVGAGGALGAIARYLINISPLKNLVPGFPFPSLLINVLGSFLIGILVVVFTERYGVAENVQLAFVVGFLGAFTTFSTFEFETWGLIDEGRYLRAITYVALSVVTGFAAVVAGISLGKRI